MMTLEEEGAYIRLLGYCWRDGKVPADPNKLARLIGKGASEQLATNISTMFEPSANHPSFLVHDRLERERQKQIEWRLKSAKGGRKSGKSRQVKGGSTTLGTKIEPPLEPNGNQDPNQMATLQSSSSACSLPPSVSVLQSSSSSSTPKPHASKRRPDGLLDGEMALAMRLAGLFGRRESTTWKDTEVKAFRKFAVTAAPEDIELVVWHYGTPAEFKRQDLGTLLNNFAGAIDRAKVAKAESLQTPATPPRNGESQIVTAPTGILTGVHPTAQAGIFKEEMNRVQEQLNQLRETYASHQVWTQVDIDTYKNLKVRKKELREKLGLPKEEIQVQRRVPAKDELEEIAKSREAYSQRMEPPAWARPKSEQASNNGHDVSSKVTIDVEAAKKQFFGGTTS